MTERPHTCGDERVTDDELQKFKDGSLDKSEIAALRARVGRCAGCRSHVVRFFESEVRPVSISEPHTCDNPVTEEEIRAYRGGELTLPEITAFRARLLCRGCSTTLVRFINRVSAASSSLTEAYFFDEGNPPRL